MLEVFWKQGVEMFHFQETRLIGVATRSFSIRFHAYVCKRKEKPPPVGLNLTASACVSLMHLYSLTFFFYMMHSYTNLLGKICYKGSLFSLCYLQRFWWKKCMFETSTCLIL